MLIIGKKEIITGIVTVVVLLVSLIVLVLTASSALGQVIDRRVSRRLRTEAVMLIWDGELESAKDLLEESFELNPEDWQTSSFLGDIYFSLDRGRSERSVEAYKRAVELEPRACFTYSRMLRALNGFDRFEEVDSVGTEALNCSLEDENADNVFRYRVYTHIGYAHYELGQFSHAEIPLREAKSLEPRIDSHHHEAVTSFYLAKTLFEKEGGEQEVCNLLEEAEEAWIELDGEELRKYILVTALVYCE